MYNEYIKSYAAGALYSDYSNYSVYINSSSSDSYSRSGSTSSGYANQAVYVQRSSGATTGGTTCTENYTYSTWTAASGTICHQYSNYANATTNTDTGVAGTPSFSWSQDPVVPNERIEDTIAKIQELRDKINLLDQGKWRADNSTPDLSAASDTTFSDSNPETREVVASSQYQALKNSLAVLYNSITVDPSKTDLDSTNILSVLQDQGPGSKIDADDANRIRTAIQEIRDSCYQAYSNVSYAPVTQDIPNYGDSGVARTGYSNTYAQYSNYSVYSRYSVNYSNYNVYSQAYSQYGRYNDHGNVE